MTEAKGGPLELRRERQRTKKMGLEGRSGAKTPSTGGEGRERE